MSGVSGEEWGDGEGPRAETVCFVWDGRQGSKAKRGVEHAAEMSEVRAQPGEKMARRPVVVPGLLGAVRDGIGRRVSRLAAGRECDEAGTAATMSQLDLYTGDSLEVLKGLPSRAAHFAVTSPPYY